MNHKPYIHQNGYIYQCVYCKKFKDPLTKEYIKVEADLSYLKDHILGVSHGVCKPCLVEWFKRDGLDADLEEILKEVKNE